MSLVPQGPSFNHWDSGTAQVSHVLWLNDSKTNSNNLIWIISEYVHVCVSTCKINIKILSILHQKKIWSGLQKSQQLEQKIMRMPSMEGEWQSMILELLEMAVDVASTLPLSAVRDTQVRNTRGVWRQALQTGAPGRQPPISTLKVGARGEILLDCHLAPSHYSCLQKLFSPPRRSEG